MKYKILSERTIKELEIQVNHHLSQGWIIQGVITSIKDSFGWNIAQAITLEEGVNGLNKDTPTENMKEFMEANKESPVVFRDRCGNCLIYKINNHNLFWLSEEDIRSVDNFTPDWGF